MISSEEIKSNISTRDISNCIASASSGPDLREILNKSRAKLKSNYGLQLKFKEQLKNLRLTWFPFDKFFQEMLDNLLEDFEIEMMQDIEQPDNNYLIISNYIKKREIYTTRGIVEVRFLRPTGNLLKEVEYETIKHVLNVVDGNRTEASKILGISIRTLRNKLQEYCDSGLLVQSEINIKQQIESTNKEDIAKKKFLQPLSKHDIKIQRKPFTMATCCPNNFVWEKGLCFKCWKEEKNERDKRNSTKVHSNTQPMPS
jgi:hypothetical protein